MTMNLGVRRGDTLTATFAIEQNVEGWTARWTCKPVSNWPDTLDTGATITATEGAGLTVTEGTPSSIALSIAASVTALLAAGVYVWDLQLTNGLQVWTFADTTDGSTVGSLTVTGDVTRTTP